MKGMANAMLDVMIKEEGGKINYHVLTHVHNLVPYSDNRILSSCSSSLWLDLCVRLCVSRVRKGSSSGK